MVIDPIELSALEAYKLATSLIVPRPIAWVGSRSESGVDNLAPFSYFMGVSSKPPSIAISVARGRGGSLKDTATNILNTGEFSVSVVSHSMKDPMVQSSLPMPPTVSEFEAVGLAASNCAAVNAPHPTEAAATMECRLVHSHDMGSTHLFVGEVVQYRFADGVLVEDERGHRTVDIKALDAIGRLGGYSYCRITERFELRPQK
jgi:flavin reductase (DIM6/NTAB) family NADH-FMN oxidoreductase RutF